MFTLEDKLRLNDKEYTLEKMREMQNQRLAHKTYTFKFPCHDVNVELEKPEDTYVECPTCHKHYLMTFNGNRTKLWST